MEEEQAHDTATEWLKTLGLQRKLRQYGGELSGGLKQRVILARTLAMGPSVFLFDEVTSALDPEWGAWVRDLMREIAKRDGIVLNVSHKINLIREISDWVIFLQDGVLVEQGPPEEVIDHPASDQLRLFLLCS